MICVIGFGAGILGDFSFVFRNFGLALLAIGVASIGFQGKRVGDVSNVSRFPLEFQSLRTLAI